MTNHFLRVRRRLHGGRNPKSRGPRAWPALPGLQRWLDRRAAAHGHAHQGAEDPEDSGGGQKGKLGIPEGPLVLQEDGSWGGKKGLFSTSLEGNWTLWVWVGKIATPKSVALWKHGPEPAGPWYVDPYPNRWS